MIQHDPHAVARAVTERKTLKVLGDPDQPVKLPAEICSKNDAIVRECLQTAGWAPFHYDRGSDGLAEPWRAHVMWQDACRQTARDLPNWIGDTTAGKLPAMLAACGSAVVVTWLPQFRDQANVRPEQIRIDDEHLAAASAMVQSFLLLLTSHGMGTYWSSGGVFRTPAVYQQLGIPVHESLIAVVFIEYPETLDQQRERKPGKQRDRRSQGWIREARL